ncbi:2OG-Fe(II) oxygenase [Ramlibacter tataouinensis]|uniref:2OG-Fe(II) oxygenase n=1 Tax=Ramlibacter tataouinensis TaxID=94132 RepID=UPI0022F38066|nr:2OG-Fe(II) oxygenase [Ramlibacter tataouinensis]WBY00852.1 2OG-Fe(II) oxygenase [Ramlibacter tataouinensis]
MTTRTQQQVTPELRRWIVEQAQAGHSAESVLRSMLASGWQEEVAMQAMESTLRSHLEAKAAADGLPPSVPVPDPRLDESPLYVDAGDRRVHVLQNMYNPRVVVFGSLLSDEECDALIALAQPRMARSLTVATKTGGEEVNDDRTSSGMFFQRGENELVSRIEARIARLLNWPEENGEGLQVLHYRPGAEYKPHYDYFDPAEPGTPTILKRGGQRVGTLVIYLAEPEKGGGTTFPDVHLEVFPKRGHGVFFSYERPHPSTRTLHGGAPVLAGEKWIATKWLRERRFE